MTNQNKILLSRFLTRFGDQAWDFAVPLVLIQLLPGKVQLISLFYLCSKLAQIIFGPSLIKKIDSKKRINIYKMGIGYQTVAMSIMWIFLSAMFFIELNGNFAYYAVLLVLFVTSSTVSSLGSALMDASVGFDLAVDILEKYELPLFNSRLSRLDLITEVSAPIFTGLILSLFLGKASVYGFSIIALLNLVTFFPEYLLLRSITNLDAGKIYSSEINNTKSFKNILNDFVSSFNRLKDKPYGIVIFGYAALWLSVLSPHGVLLTSFLKDGNRTSEFTIGLFRGLGACFGIIPTFLYPYLRKKKEMVSTSKIFLIFQFICVLAAGISFYFLESIYPFLIFILFSRIGLYGFSIGETEIRQNMIANDSRGEVNGMASSITSMATLFLFFLGTIFGKSENFGILIIISVVAVLFSLMMISKINDKDLVIENKL